MLSQGLTALAFLLPMVTILPNFILICQWALFDVIPFRKPAVRIYFQEIDNTLVLLLCGGKKNANQRRDIARAKSYSKQSGMMEI